MVIYANRIILPRIKSGVGVNRTVGTLVYERHDMIPGEDGDRTW